MNASRKRKVPEVIIISSDEDEHPHAPKRKRPKRPQESPAPETSTGRFCTSLSHQSSHTNNCEECGEKRKRWVANDLRTAAGPQSSREALLPRKSSFHQAEPPHLQQRLLGPKAPKYIENQEGHTGPFSTRSSLIPVSPSLTANLSKQTTEELYKCASTDHQLASMLYSLDSWYESRRLLNIRLQSPAEVLAMNTLHPRLARRGIGK